MITRRMAAALVAGSLAVGLVAGTAGTIIAKDTTPSQTAAAACIDHMDDMGGMMNGAGGMMGPGTSAMPDYMQQHHAVSSQAPVQ